MAVPDSDEAFLAAEGLSAEDLVFIGDALEDFAEHVVQPTPPYNPNWNRLVSTSPLPRADVTALLGIPNTVPQSQCWTYSGYMSKIYGHSPEEYHQHYAAPHPLVNFCAEVRYPPSPGFH